MREAEMERATKDIAGIANSPERSNLELVLDTEGRVIGLRNILTGVVDYFEKVGGPVEE